LVIYFSQRDVVTPGQLLAKGMYRLGDNVYRIGQSIYATTIGLAELRDNTVNVIPLKGCYVPHVGDLVIGLVVDVSLTSWTVDIASPYTALLQVNDAFSKPIDPLKENLRKYFDVGDYIVANVIAFDKTRDPLLSTKEPPCGKIEKGTVVEISPAKIPRLIGKRGSMISIIRKELSCQIMAGRNGRIWVYSKNPSYEEIAVKVIKKIEQEAHVAGLTDRVKEMIRRLRR